MHVCMHLGERRRNRQGERGGNNIPSHRYRTQYSSYSISFSSQKTNILTKGNQAAKG